MRVKTGLLKLAVIGIFVCFSVLAMAAPPTWTISGVVATADGTGVEGVDVVGDNGATSAVTAADGSYSIIVSNHWDGTVTISKTGWLITPGSKSYTNVVENLTGQNYTAYQPKISGYVTKSDGTRLEEVIVSADNGGGSAMVDVFHGYYKITVPYNWSGTVTATLEGYHFTDKSYTNVIANLHDQDFTGYQPTISGSTGVTNALVDASDLGGKHSNPNYSFTVPYGWSGTISAALYGYYFAESPRVYANVTSDIVSQDFTPYQPTISGYVKRPDGTGLEGASVTANNQGASGLTNPNGYYEISVPYNWSGAVSVALLGYGFTDKSYTSP